VDTNYIWEFSNIKNKKVVTDDRSSNITETENTDKVSIIYISLILAIMANRTEEYGHQDQIN
jgi:hypothetical protein